MSTARTPVSLRRALLVGVLVILLAAVGLSGLFSYLNAQAIVDDLSGDVLAQTSARVQDQLRSLVDGAGHMGTIRARALSRRAWTDDDLLELVQEFHDAIQLNQSLSFLSIGLETGGYAHVYRDAMGVLDGRVQTVQPDGRTLRHDYRFVRGRLDPAPKTTAFGTYDPRKRGWYIDAKAAGTQQWPDVYLFINPPNPDYPGLTCATPVLNPQGEIQGVTTADFDLLAIGRYLRGLDVLRGGSAFILEVSSSGVPRVIAHPRTETLIGRVEVDGELKDVILPIDKIPDVPVRQLVRTIDTSAAPGNALRRERVQSDNYDFEAAYQWLGNDHGLRWIVAFLVPRGALMAEVDKTSRQVLWIGIVAMLAAAVLAWFLARRIVRPLEALVRETQAIARFELEPTRAEQSRFTELRQLSDSVEEMKSGLRSFRRYVPADVVRQVLSTGQEVKLGGERRELTVCFSDIQGFTALAERMPPEQVVELLGDYFEAVTKAFMASEGTVDKFIGDSVMAFWGAPREQAQHAAYACRGALAARAGVTALGESLVSVGKQAIHVRFGVGTGQLVVGNIGSSARLNYTVIGDPVNLASRLESLNKMYGTTILIDQLTRESAGAAIVARPIERVAVRGRAAGSVVYELLAMNETATDKMRQRAVDYERALEQVQSRQFDEAQASYESLLKADPMDGAAFVLLQRCMALVADPPDADWDGVFSMGSA